MIIRQLCMRQSRQLLALNRARTFNRFNSTDNSPDFPDPSVQTWVQMPSPDASLTPAETEEQPPSPFQPPTVVQPRSEEQRRATPRNTAAERRRNAREQWRASQTKKHKAHATGSVVDVAYAPEDIIRNPPRPSDITLELLLASQTHLGHSTSRWNPLNSRYIFGIRDGIHIISLDVTAAYLRRAAKVVEEVAARGGLLLFVGTKEGQKRPVVRAAELARGYHVFERWIPGSLTNGQQILGRCETKVVNAYDAELPQFQKHLEGRAAVKPDLVICLNPVENIALLHECGLNNVPTIGVIDTDADSTRVTYPIPSNDDSLRATAVIVGILGRAGEAGQRRRLALAEAGALPYEPVTIQELESNPVSGRQ